MGPERVALVQWRTQSSLVGGIVLGFLVQFRNNAAYARWWEARQLWGRLINEVRNLCLKARAHIGPDDPKLAVLARTLYVFSVALMGQLRGQISLRDLSGYETCLDRPQHVPTYLAGRVHEQLAEWYTQGRIDGHVLRMLDEHARSLMDICGACERIRNTPLSPSYRALLRHGLLLYAVITPPYLVNEVGWWGLPIFLVMTYFIFGVELTAEAIEDPFGTEGDDLGLEGYCQTVLASTLQVAGQETSER